MTDFPEMPDYLVRKNHPEWNTHTPEADTSKALLSEHHQRKYREARKHLKERKMTHTPGLSALAHGMELRRGDRVKSTVKDDGLTYRVKSKHRDGTLTVKLEGLPCEGGGELFRCSPQSLRLTSEGE